MLEITDHEELVEVVRQGIAGAQWTGRRFYYYDWMEDAVQYKSQDSRGGELVLRRGRCTGSEGQDAPW